MRTAGLDMIPGVQHCIIESISFLLADVVDVSEISNRLDSVETVGLAVRRKFLFGFITLVEVPLNCLFAPAP
jgi:hypothetical protein